MSQSNQPTMPRGTALCISPFIISFFFLFTCLSNCFVYTSPFYHILAYHHWMRGTIHRDKFSKKIYQNSILDYGKIYFFLSEARLVKFGLLGQIQPHGHAQGLDFKWPCLYFLKQQLTAVQNVKLEIFIVDYTVSFFFLTVYNSGRFSCT